AIFSLLAISATLSYSRRPSGRQLLLIFFINLLAFLTHEEALWLPPFLFLLLLMQRTGRLFHKKRKGGWPKIHWGQILNRSELLLFGLLFGLMLLYVVVQFVRPNPTVQASE